MIACMVKLYMATWSDLLIKTEITSITIRCMIIR